MDKSIHTTQHAVLQSVLRNLRIEAGLRQTELAERIEEHQSFVSKYEAGERRLDFVEIRAICHAVQVPMHELVTRFERKLNEAES